MLVQNFSTFKKVLLASLISLPILANQANLSQNSQPSQPNNVPKMQPIQGDGVLKPNRIHQPNKDAAKMAQEIKDALNASKNRAENYNYISSQTALKDRAQRDILNSSLAKPADEPKDTPIKVITHNAEKLCYTPTFTKGDGYIYLDYCNNINPNRARYDLFGRISYQLNGNKLCMTAPSSVTGIGTAAYNSWDYITLRPCVINDPNQQWVVTDDAIYTKDKRFRIKDYKYYAYISKNSSDWFDHKLDSSMKEWANTVASPDSIIIKTPVFWHYFSYPSGWRPYFLTDNQSTSEYLVNLYYNTQNGHIAQYHPEDGSLKCLTSDHKKGQTWNWASWINCKDTTSKEAHNALYWSVDISNENDYMLRDYWGDILRVTKYGTNWGVPYTVSPLYIDKDTSKSPTSNFTMAKEIKWFKEINYANMLDELNYCPTQKERTRVKRGLPEDFSLSEGWLGRLWQINISRSSDAPQASIGLCGVCLLQSAQMVSELMSHPEPRGSGGGYLFDTAGETNPFISFQARYPYIAYSLNGVLNEISWLRYGESDNFISYMVPPLLSTASMLLPNYTLHPSPMVRGDMALDLATQLFSGHPGTLWLAFMYRTAPDGSMPIGHSEPLLLTRDGLVTLPTNRVLSFEEFREATRPMHSSRELIDYYTSNGRVRLGLLMFIRVGEIDHENPLDLRISPRNCTGEGEHRRGNAMPIDPNQLNQCSGAYGGRCM